MNDTQNNFQKDMYQVPPSADGEIVDAPVVSEATDLAVDAETADFNRQFDTIAREEVLLAFNRMTQDLEMSVSGYENRQQPPVEILSNPTIIELRQVGDDMLTGRNEFHASLVETAKFRGMLRGVLGILFTNNAAQLPRPTIESIVEHESNLDSAFPKDGDVVGTKFFFLPDANGVHKWHYSQTSPLKEKTFTNTYTVSDVVVKSSTFFDQRSGQEVNVSVPVDEPEVQNLLVAAKHHYSEATGKIYVKAAAPRLRFRSKSNDTPAA